MLHDFLATNRAELIERCRLKVAQRSLPKAIEKEREYGIPRFLDQLVETLQAVPERSKRLSGEADSRGSSALSEMGMAASRHGRELSREGYTVEQVIRDYGDLCQAITDTAFEKSARIEVDEFRTLNRCLDNAIADSVTEWGYQNGLANADSKVAHMDLFVYELRKLIHTATLAVMAIKAGDVGISGATGSVLDTSLIELSKLVDRSIVGLRGQSELPVQNKLISLADFVAACRISASFEAQSFGCTLTVSPVDPALAVDADENMLLSAVGHLLHNAFRFTQPNTEVALDAYAVGDRILIDIADHCGGLDDTVENMFLPFTQSGANDGHYGMATCRHSVVANNGLLSVRNLPGSGCVFTISFARHALLPSVRAPAV